MPWSLIRQLLGPGLAWSHSQEKYNAAIRRAEELGRKDAADHLRGMLELRNQVLFETPIGRIEDFE